MSVTIALTEVLADNQHKKEIGMNEQPNAEMSQEDRLKAVLYQFITLYERWAEDRQLAAKQGADTAELIKLFSAQVKDFKTLESKVRQELANTVHQSATAATKEMTEKISKIATEQVDSSAKRLHKAADEAAHQMNAYRQQFDRWLYGSIAAIFVVAIVVGVLVAHFIMPEPYLPLTGQQLQTYEHGRLFEAFWPKLSKKEKDHLIGLANTKNTEQVSGIDSNDNTYDVTNDVN